MILPALLLSAVAAPHCGTPEMLLSRPLRPFRPANVVRADGDGKARRYPFGELPNLLESDNFTLAGGPSNGDTIDATRAQTLLEAFEHAFSVEVGELGNPAPLGSDTFKFSVFFGNTGGGLPATDWAGAFTTQDDDGYPYIVVSPEMFAQYDDGYMAQTAAHELFHAVQMATGVYEPTLTNAWYWEATATWIMPLVVPGGGPYADFLGGYLLDPAKPVSLIDQSSQSVTAYHQYGAFIFPQYLSELRADPALIFDSWRAAPDVTDPLASLAALLSARGDDLGEAFGDFAAHNVLLDYADGALYAEAVDMLASAYPEFDHRLAALHTGTGSDGFAAPDASTLPRAFGYNVIQLAGPSEGNLRVDFLAEEYGSQGTAAVFQATLVRQRPEGITYHSLPIEGFEGAVEVSDVGGDISDYLVVAATPATRKGNEVFPYYYSLRVKAPSTGEGKTDDGGCAATPVSLVAVLVPLLSFMLRRRRAS